MEVDNLSKSEESQYTINFHSKLICIGNVSTPSLSFLQESTVVFTEGRGEGEVVLQWKQLLRDLFPFASGWALSPFSRGSGAGLPATSLICGWSLAIRTLGTTDRRKVLQLLIAAGRCPYGEFVILNFWAGQQRFPALGDQTF